MIPVSEARARILDTLAPVPAETIALSDAWNRVLAADILARRTQPPHDVSAMDGWAVRAADASAGATLRRIGTAPAGHPFHGTVGPGETVRLFTGSVVPAGADAIVIQEDARESATGMTVTEAAEPGRHIRRAGQDFHTGQVLLRAGRRLSARDIGLAAAGDHPWLTVHRRPRVAILATGDEIALPGEPVPPGGIVSSNAHALAALVRAAGGDPTVLPIAQDTLASMAEAADRAVGFDLLLTTGGASVGDHDLVQPGLATRGMALDFWKIAMRPGKPLMYGRLGALPLLGLPGNPVSALVCAVLFALPALRVLGGQAASGPLLEQAVLGAALKPNDHREDYLRARLEHGVVTANPRQDSGMMAALAWADALIVRPPHAASAAAGDTVNIIRLTGHGI